MIEPPDIREKRTGNGIEKYHISNINAEEIVARYDKDKDYHEGDRANGIEQKIAPHGDFGDTKGGFLGGIGSAAEALLLVRLSSVGFDADNVRDSIGELASLFVLGSSESGIDMASFVESYSSDYRVSDGEE